MARENLGGIWVDPLATYPGWPGIPRTWDVRHAVAEAYAAGTPLRLAFYSADSDYHSGRYFYSSDSDNVQGRPILKVQWGDPIGAVHKTVWPSHAASGQQVTYTLSLLGSGRVVTLADRLDTAISAPGSIGVQGGGVASYTSVDRRVDWTGLAAVGQPVTITFPVTVMTSTPMAINNTVILSDVVAGTSTATTVFVANGYSTFLPLAMR